MDSLRWCIEYGMNAEDNDKDIKEKETTKNLQSLCATKADFHVCKSKAYQIQ